MGCYLDKTQVLDFCVSEFKGIRTMAKNTFATQTLKFLNKIGYGGGVTLWDHKHVVVLGDGRKWAWNGHSHFYSLFGDKVQCVEV